jgi:hypothetical protein
LKPHFTPRALGILFSADGGGAFLHLRRVESGIEDLRVRTAAAQISCDRQLYIVQIRIWIPFEQRSTAHDHPWSAEPALERIVLDECGLYWMKIVAVWPAPQLW